MSTYREYQAQIEELQRKAAAARKEELGNTIREIKRKIAEFGLSAADLGLAPAEAKTRGRKAAAKPAGDAAAKPGRRKAKRATTGKKIAPKYRGPNGELWTGRGRQPVWVGAELGAGRTLEDLLIK